MPLPAHFDMAKDIFLICGVPGSGKTWVSEQLKDQYEYVPHDKHPIESYGSVLASAAKTATKPIIAECPFRMSQLIEELKAKNVSVNPYFIVEMAKTVRERYEKRESKPIPKQHISAIGKLRGTADKYKAITGTSDEIHRYLKGAAMHRKGFRPE